MASPLVPQGTLNRLRSSVIFAANPTLNVTSSFLSKRAITLSFAGDATVYLDTLTGAVTSPEPYLRATLTVHLIKAQSFANQYKLALESNTLLGDATVRPDSPAMQPYALSNCAIMGVGDRDFSGQDADFIVRIGGIYVINSTLYL
jgi:hypothetical protein